MEYTAIIRNRGQLTIPDRLREELGWLQAPAPVSLKVENKQTIKITPHKKNKKINKEKLWKLIEEVRSYKGKNKISLSEFIIRDRERH